MRAPSPLTSTKLPAVRIIRCAPSSKPTPATTKSRYSRQTREGLTWCYSGVSYGVFHRLKMPIAEEAPASITEPFGQRSAGAMLRQQREALGLDLDQVAATLRIKPAYLAALEAGRPEKLPGAVYAIGYMRAYADRLGLRSGEMLRRFKQESTLLTAKPDLAFPIQLGERSMPGAGIVLVAL